MKKKLASRKKMLLSTFPLHSRHNPDLQGSFWKLYLVFHFWTFIFVHFQKPKILFEKKMLLKITTFSQHLVPYDKCSHHRNYN